MTVNTQIRRRDYLRRHARTMAPHLTPRKCANILLNLHERRQRVVRPRSLPPFLKIEPSAVCQLSCPGCPQSRPDFRAAASSKGQMAPEDFRRVVDTLAATTVGISLSNQGEPLLNRRLPDMIEHAHRRNVAVTFPTNFSMPLADDRIDDLVAAGLDTLYVSLDGATPETYGVYRRGGDFGRVLANVRTLAEAKRRRRRKTPRIVWKFVVFPHNRHEIAVVESSCRDWGFDEFEFVLDSGSTAFAEDRTRYRADQAARRSVCYWPWHTLLIRSDGSVGPCCSSKEFGLGNAFETDPVEIWRSDAFAAVRAGLASPAAAERHPVCRGCLRET